MKIVIATGIYPPKTSGPAQYAKNMNDLWSKMGHEVRVKTYGIENYLPTGIRHLFFFIKIIPALIQSDVVFALDTFSVGFPATLASRIFGKKIVIRTGGDFLWEGYVERTNDLVLLRNFYDTRIQSLSLKERIIFRITKWTLKKVDVLVFSTKWQKDIFLKPYMLDNSKIIIIENHYEKINSSFDNTGPGPKTFIAGVRPLKWKNIDFLQKVFLEDEIRSKNVALDISNSPHKEFLEKMAKSYAVILGLLWDISHHLILDAISLNKPFIITEENGFMDRISDIAITINPKKEEDIKKKVLWLLDSDNYLKQIEKIKEFSFTHTWSDIAQEYIDLFNKIK